MPDYGSIISKSIEATKKFKWLWVYGIVITAFAAGAGGGGSNISSNLNNIPGGESFQLPDQLPDNIQEDPTQVLGGFTSSLADWFKSVPTSTWILLVFAIILAIVFSLVIKMVWEF